MQTNYKGWTVGTSVIKQPTSDRQMGVLTPLNNDLSFYLQYVKACKDDLRISREVSNLTEPFDSLLIFLPASLCKDMSNRGEWFRWKSSSLLRQLPKKTTQKQFFHFQFELYCQHRKTCVRRFSEELLVVWPVQNKTYFKASQDEAQIKPCEGVELRCRHNFCKPFPWCRDAFNESTVRPEA